MEINRIRVDGEYVSVDYSLRKGKGLVNELGEVKTTLKAIDRLPRITSKVIGASKHIHYVPIFSKILGKILVLRYFTRQKSADDRIVDNFEGGIFVLQK